MIDRETIDRIYAAANIVDIVGDYVTLRRKGVNYEACCPFHQEKTPSFKVSPARGIYKCFGCGKSGNAINFIMETESATYPEALRIVAKRYGIEVREEAMTEEDIARNNNRESMFALNAWAAEYFQRYMFMEDEGRSVGLSYFSSLRGFSDATIRKFGLGFCPSSGLRFLEDCRAAGYKDEFLLSTGLAFQRESDGALRDRFYDRVMFPIHNVSGRVVGFGGRTLRTDKKVAKYQNSPESEIYNKRRELYGLFFAKKAIQQEDCAIMVEGYADVISMHQAGVENVVASSGTSLTEEQVRLLSRFTRNMTLMFDGDAAGVKAALRGVDIVLKEDMNVRIVLLPEEHDPDTFARAHSSEELRKYISDNAQDFLAFKARLLLGEATSDPLKRSEAIQDMVQSIAVIPDQIKRSEYVRYCAEIMNVEQQVLAVAVARKLDGIRGNGEAQDFLTRQQRRDYDRATPQSLYVAKPEQGDERPQLTAGTTIDTLEREVAKYLLKYGHLDFVVVEDKEEFQFNVARYIFEELEADGLQLREGVYRSIYELYRAEWERLGDGVEVPTHVFVSHADNAVASTSIDLLTSDDGYVISKIWEMKDVHIESVEEQLSEGVPKVVILFKWRMLEARMSELKAIIGSASEEDEELASTVALFTKYQAARVAIAKTVGRLI
ncbi:MAG: DNA primase [Alistipes sp.]|uniref:DNA primase n=1 Tax=Alistipes sp. TaxID=1872444 RepID=UPI001B6D0950|nr:DNA primase [Alistipes sp.]